jgi:hypothetical protein
MLTLKQRQERAARRAARIAAMHDAIRAAACTGNERSLAMKKHEVKVGAKYLAKVSDKVVPVRIDGENPHGGWDATNEATGKKVHIKSAQRLRGEAKPKAAAKEAAPAADVGPTAKPDAKVAPEAKGKKPKAAKPKGERKPGILTLAADVLKDAKAPMDCKSIVEKVLAKGLWQTKGKTPAATLYAAIIREITAKGKEARFHKTDRGMFELSAAARQ